MAKVAQIRGALLEEAILYLLELVGYQTVEASAGEENPQDIRVGHSGLEVKGRGAWHQIDALASFENSPVFMYPLRLIVEAKCYKYDKRVGIEVIRNAVGVLKDISENYFTIESEKSPGKIQIPRFNYHSAVFSTSGYTYPASKYAIAHQVFLIQYKKVPVILPLIKAIKAFNDSSITDYGRENISKIRKLLRNKLKDEDYVDNAEDLLTSQGIFQINTAIVKSVKRIKGSYFGMLQGRWPLHLLSDKELPPMAFVSDIINCKVRGNESGEWSFTPSNYNLGDRNWFSLQFNLPEEIALLVKEVWGDPIQVADLKQQHFSYIYVSGKIGGIQRNVRLQLDREWIEEYIDRIRRKSRQ